MYMYYCTLQELPYRTEVVPVDLINRSIGIDQPADKIASLLTRMCLKSEVCNDGGSIAVEVPPTRAGEGGVTMEPSHLS